MKERKLEMKRVAEGVHLQAARLFGPRKAQTIEINTAWAAVSFYSAKITHSFLQLSGLGRTFQPGWGRTVVRSRINEYSKRTGSPSVRNDGSVIKAL